MSLPGLRFPARRSPLRAPGVFAFVFLPLLALLWAGAGRLPGETLVPEGGPENGAVDAPPTGGTAITDFLRLFPHDDGPLRDWARLELRGGEAAAEAEGDYRVRDVHLTVFRYEVWAGSSAPEVKTLPPQTVAAGAGQFRIVEGQGLLGGHLREGVRAELSDGARLEAQGCELTRVGASAARVSVGGQGESEAAYRLHTDDPVRLHRETPMLDLTAAGGMTTDLAGKRAQQVELRGPIEGELDDEVASVLLGSARGGSPGAPRRTRLKAQKALFRPSVGQEPTRLDLDGDVSIVRDDGDRLSAGRLELDLDRQEPHEPIDEAPGAGTPGAPARWSLRGARAKGDVRSRLEGRYTLEGDEMTWDARERQAVLSGPRMTRMQDEQTGDHSEGRLIELWFREVEVPPPAGQSGPARRELRIDRVRVLDGSGRYTQPAPKKSPKDQDKTGAVPAPDRHWLAEYEVADLVFSAAEGSPLERALMTAEKGERRVRLVEEAEDFEAHGDRLLWTVVDQELRLSAGAGARIDLRRGADRFEAAVMVVRRGEGLARLEGDVRGILMEPARDGQPPQTWDLAGEKLILAARGAEARSRSFTGVPSGQDPRELRIDELDLEGAPARLISAQRTLEGRRITWDGIWARAEGEPAVIVSGQDRLRARKAGFRRDDGRFELEERVEGEALLRGRGGQGDRPLSITAQRIQGRLVDLSPESEGEKKSPGMQVVEGLARGDVVLRSEEGEEARAAEASWDATQDLLELRGREGEPVRFRRGADRLQARRVQVYRTAQRLRALGAVQAEFQVAPLRPIDQPAQTWSLQADSVEAEFYPEGQSPATPRPDELARLRRCEAHGQALVLENLAEGLRATGQSLNYDGETGVGRLDALAPMRPKLERADDQATADRIELRLDRAQVRLEGGVDGRFRQPPAAGSDGPPTPWELSCASLVLQFDPDTRGLLGGLARRDVRIASGSSTAYADEALWERAEGSIALVGEPVRIEEPGNRSEARQVELDLQRRNYTFRGGVRGEFTPDQLLKRKSR